MSINAVSLISNVNNNVKEKESVGIQDALSSSILLTIMRAEVLATGENKPNPNEPTRAVKPFFIQVLLVTIREISGKKIQEQKVIKINSEILPPPLGIQTMVVETGKIEQNQWYTYQGALDEKLPLVQSISSFVKLTKVKK